MSEPVKIDSVTDASSHKEVGIAPLNAAIERDLFSNNVCNHRVFEIVTSVVFAIVLITFIIGLSKLI